MNDGYEYDDYEDEPSEGLSEPQENPVRTLRKRGDALAKENKELKSRLAALEQSRRADDIARALREAGVNEKVAKLVPSDVPPDGVNAWLEEYGDVLGVQKTATAPEPETPASQDPEVQAMQAMQTMSASGSVPSGQVSDADLMSAPSKEAFWELLRKYGVTPPS